MSDPLSEAVRRLVSALSEADGIVDTRRKGQERSAYLSTGTTTGGPLAEQLPLRKELGKEILKAVGSVEGLIDGAPHAEGIVRWFELVRSSLDQTGDLRPRVEMSIIEELEAAIHKRELALAQSAHTDSDPNIVRIGPLQIHPLTKRVSLGKKSAIIEHAVTFEVLLLIARANGRLVPTSEIRKKVPGCRVGRIDVKLTRHLPAWTRDLVRGQSGHHGGYALQLPEKIVRN
jgi:hypothetical protein